MAEEEKSPAPAEATPPPAPPSSNADGESLDAPVSTSPATPATSGVGEPIQDSSKKSGAVKSTFNIYFIIFIIVVAAAIGIIIFAVSSATKEAKSTTTKTQTLTSDQLTELKGNTTIVGDAKQTLDIQSNSVFAGQVLVRSDLSVAGALKVGGALSLNDLNVTGTGAFGGLSVSGTSTFNGNTAIQGTLSVQKGINVTGGASFGSLNVGQLSVTSLQLTGDLSINRHLVTGGGNPTRTVGTALGGGGTASISGSDTAGTLTINTGNNPPAGIFATVAFVQRYPSTPRVIVTPVGSAAGAVNYYVTRDTGGFSIGTSTPPPAGASFAFDYFVIN